MSFGQNPGSVAAISDANALADTLNELLHFTGWYTRTLFRPTIWSAGVLGQVCPVPPPQLGSRLSCVALGLVGLVPTGPTEPVTMTSSSPTSAIVCPASPST